MRSTEPFALLTSDYRQIELEPLDVDLFRATAVSLSQTLHGRLLRFGPRRLFWPVRERNCFAFPAAGCFRHCRKYCGSRQLPVPGARAQTSAAGASNGSRVLNLCSGVFGGQMIGQSLAAAAKSVRADMQLHSMHSYFLQKGSMDDAIIYNVRALRDGTSYATRLVTGAASATTKPHAATASATTKTHAGAVRCRRPAWKVYLRSHCLICGALPPRPAPPGPAPPGPAPPRPAPPCRAPPRPATSY